MKPQLTHIALHVPDTKSCATFYTNYCGMKEVRQHGTEAKPVIWLAEPGKENEFVIVLIGGNNDKAAISSGYSHLGFALQSKAAVDKVAQKAERDGCLLWPPRQDPYPAEYYCGVTDPAGNQVEFSFGQPLGEG